MENYYNSKLSKALFSLLVFASMLMNLAKAQPISGTKTICVSGCDYPSISSAVAALNANGVGTGGATFNIAAGYSEALTAPLVMTATGTAATPIIFQKSGTGANPLITAYEGIKLASSTDSLDVMWAFVGSDFVTISEIDLLESATNTTPTMMMEVGYGFYKGNAFDGCNNNTIQNCTITLNRDNFVAAAAGPRQNGSGSVAIEFINSLRTSVGTALAISAVSGASSNNKIYGNTIQNCHFGITLSGFAAPSPYTLADQNNEIGGNTVGTGNNIVNFGGGATSTNACGAMLINNQWSFSIQRNLVNNNNGTGLNHGGSNRGIWLFNSSAGASATIKHNRISIAAGTNTGSITWCLDLEMATSGANGNTINIDSNEFINCTNTSASTVAFTAIWLNTAATNVNVRGNRIYGFTYLGTGTSQCILSQLACGNLNISNNIIDSVTLGGTTGSGTHHNIGVTSAPSVSLNIRDNIVTRTTLNTTGTGTKTLYGIYYTGATPVNNFIGNTVDSITRNGTSGGTTIGIYQVGGTNGTSTTTVRRNKISNFSITGTGTGSTMYGIQVSTGTIIVDSNEIFNLNIAKTTASGALYGIYDISSPTNEQFNVNRVYNLNNIGTGLVYGIYAFTTTGVRTVAGNTIYNLTGNSTTIGILMTSSSPTITRNKLYSISTLGTNGMAVGIRISSVGTSGFSNVAYNLISGLSSPFYSGASDGIRGIDLTTTTATSSSNVYYNTIYLDANQSGANFSSSGLFFTTNATATTATLNLRNNIIINNSVPAGTGVSSALRFSSATNSNYGSLSNNNLFYAGPISNSNLLYFDGTNRDSTLTQFKNRLAPREGSSLRENITFQNIHPDSSNYLIPAPLVPTQLESGATAISGFTGDYASLTSRASFPLSGQVNGGGSAPDIGAFEFDGIPVDLTPPTITYTNLLNTLATSNRVLTNFATITDASKVDTSLANRPRLYFKKSTDANDISGWKYVSASNTTSPFSFTIDYTLLSSGSVSPADTIEYFVVAQDMATIPNVGINNGNFTLAPSSVALGATVFPILAPVNRYNIAQPLPTTVTVGTGGTYTTFTGTGGLFEAINNNVLGGNTTVTVISDIVEPGTFALNGSGFGGFNLSIEGSPIQTYQISGAAAGPGLIRLSNVRGLKIDGGPSKSLRFSNNSTSGPVFHFQNDCLRDTLINLQILGNNTTTGNILIGQTTGTLGNDSLFITQCYFKDSFSIPTTHINSSGSVGGPNSFNVITNNEFVNFSANAINVTANGNGDKWVIQGNSSYQTASRATAISVILVQTGNGHLIRKNSIGGAAVDRSGVPFTNTSSYIRGIEISGQTGEASLIDSNYFSNIVTTSSAGVFGVYINSGNVNVNANIFGGQANTWDTIQNGYDNGIIAVIGGTTVNITNNLIGNVRYIKSSGDRTAGILVSGALNGLVIRENTIRDIFHGGTGTTTTSFRPTGIIVTGGITNSIISQNTISNINSTNTGTAAYVVSGICLSSTAIANTVVSRNRISDIGTRGIGTGTSAPTAYGIQIISQGAGNSYHNNQISMGNNTSGQTIAMGIRDESTSTLAWYFNNTIFMNGNVNGGANNSYGIFRNSTSNMVLRNNLIVNQRTTSGTGFGFATGAASASGITTATSNYNLFVVNDTARVSEFPTGVAYGVSAYNNQLYAPGYNTNWIELTSKIPAQDLFVDTLTGNLNINTNQPVSWYANGKGIAIPGYSGDFNAASGVRSVAIAAGPVDIGSHEFTTTALPPLAEINKLPALGDSTSYFFANRLLAKSVWNSGSIPSTTSLRFYSGEVPANIPSGASRMHAYYTIDNGSASNYQSTLTLMYDSSMLGNVALASRAQVARYVGTGTNWFRYTTGMVNINLALVSASNVMNEGIFALTDTASNPLPVTLLSFKGMAIGKDASLNWITGSEQNNKGFYLERSLDGKEFKQIAFIKGIGTTQRNQSYSYLDKEVFATTSNWYYRLNQVDFDGTNAYSSIILVSSKSAPNSEIQLFPNPASTAVSLMFEAKEGVSQVELKDIRGRVVKGLEAKTTEGLNTIQLNDLDGFEPGVYFVSIQQDGKVTTLKLIKN
ncbi:MAG: T9SS type A sorting domain-containing protein [Bacteroidia bacterium]|nr:T9SS type A sorting domain-containing protein [Bacteroidia bacterium]